MWPWLLCVTHRAEAAPSWGPKSLLLGLPTVASPALRFQYNFQLTSMSIEQVGQPDCWPITGNHSAPQLSARGVKGGRERTGESRLAGWEAVWLQLRSAAALRGVGEQEWRGGWLMRAVQEGALPHPYIKLWVQLLCCKKPMSQATKRVNWALRAHEEGPGGEATAWSRRGTEGGW